MAPTVRIAPCLWFDHQAEEAANFYVSLFDGSGIDSVSRFGKEGFDVHGRPAGSVMAVNFHLAGLKVTALNGGPVFTFTEAISLQIFCETQEHVDFYWNRLTEGGVESQCGWLKDRFGLSWQVVPTRLGEWLGSGDPAKTDRVMKVMLPMKKPDLAALDRAFTGSAS